MTQIKIIVLLLPLQLILGNSSEFLASHQDRQAYSIQGGLAVSLSSVKNLGDTIHSQTEYLGVDSLLVPIFLKIVYGFPCHVVSSAIIDALCCLYFFSFCPYQYQYQYHCPLLDPFVPGLILFCY